MHPFVASILFEAYGTSSFINKIIVFILLILSIYTWTVLLGKRAELRIIDKNNRKFRKNLKAKSHPLQLYLDAKGSFVPGIPVAEIYTVAIKEFIAILHRKGLTNDEITSYTAELQNVHLTETEMASIRALTEGELSEQLILIESKMSNIATMTATAPSLGLLGTVWGVMESFMAMASAGSAMITNVAPGISGALLTTVLGLIVAIPSSAGYNSLTEHIKKTSVEAENFTDKLLADIARIHAYHGQQGGL